MSRSQTSKRPKPSIQSRILTIIGSLVGGMLLFGVWVIAAPSMEEPRTIEHPRSAAEVTYNTRAYLDTHEENMDKLRGHHAIMMSISIGLPVVGGVIAVAQWQRRRSEDAANAESLGAC